MLREMSAIDWLHWKVYMGLAPFGEEREDMRAALVAQSIWNVQIAKAQGVWDSAKKKRGQRPRFRELREFILRFGDMPEWKRTLTAQEQFDRLHDVVSGWGGKPVKKHLDATGPDMHDGKGKITIAH